MNQCPDVKFIDQKRRFLYSKIFFVRLTSSSHHTYLFLSFFIIFFFEKTKFSWRNDIFLLFSNKIQLNFQQMRQCGFSNYFKRGAWRWNFFRLLFKKKKTTETFIYCFSFLFIERKSHILYITNKYLIRREKKKKKKRTRCFKRVQAPNEEKWKIDTQ